MMTVLIIIAILAGLVAIAFIPWLIGGAAAVIFCFMNEWYIAGVIIGLFAIFCQIITGPGTWDKTGSGSDSNGGTDGGFGLPEMFIAYKFGERNGKDEDH